MKDWIDWKGGECPVKFDDDVCVQLRDKRVIDGIADNFYWHHDLCDADILWYRKTTQDPHKEWVRIKKGCRMPNNKDKIIAYDKDKGWMLGQYRIASCGAVFIPDNSDICPYFKDIHSWRYPRPDQEA